jgi:hypothetical protein
MPGGGGGGGGSTVGVHVDPITSTSTVDIVGLDDIKADIKEDIKLELPQPFKTEAKNEIDVKPLSLEVKPLDLDLDLDVDSDSKTRLTIDPLTIDVRPVVADLCLTANVGKIPNLCVRQPYHHHIGLTLYGTEIWGVTFAGEQQTVVEELDRQPQVAWRGSTGEWPPRQTPPPTPPQPPTRHAGGLRVSLGP